MTLDVRKNLVVGSAIPFLLLALFDGLPYGYFTLLRFIVFAATAYITWLALNEKEEGWAWIFGGIAVLYNPFLPVYLNRGLWMFIDLIVIVFLIIAVFTLRFARKA